MNILIITTYYPPDTSISAVRPYMYAKYLSKLGHSVTVLRSGEIHECAELFFEPAPEVRVISYFGEDAPSNKIERGEIIGPRRHRKRRGLLRIAAKMYDFIKKVFLRKAISEDPTEKMEKRLELQKKHIDEMSENMEHFDVVFSTYCELENAYAGEYAAKKFNCKWIMDFRDPIAQGESQDIQVYNKNKKLQDHFILSANYVTAVSQDALAQMCRNLPTVNAGVLYNGYESLSGQSEEVAVLSDVLILCYTGQIYMRQMGGVQEFLRAIKLLLDKRKIKKSNIRIRLAGQNTSMITDEAKKIGITGLFEEYGYVSRTKASEIQVSSDVFLQFSWNTVKEQGIITGKFYEGIRAQKPVLCIVSGTMPNSELYRMNEIYHYGFCYEICRENQFDALCDYIEQAYHQKMTIGTVCYEPSPQLALDFRYDNLAKRLSNLCEELVQENR